MHIGPLLFGHSSTLQRFSLLLISGLISTLSWASSASDTPKQNAEFGPQVSWLEGKNSRTLELTGQAVRKKFFLDIYTMAHYSEPVETFAPVRQDTPNAMFDRILAHGGAKQISMVFQRDLRAKQIQNALAEGVENNCTGTEFEQVKTDLEKFSQAINQDVKKHDRFSLRWLPDGRLLSIYENQVISDIDNPLLARLLWSMWFGDDAVVERNDLIANLMTPSSAKEQLGSASATSDDHNENNKR